jgi:glycerophosphoryl diester phosphodiesterase
MAKFFSGSTPLVVAHRGLALSAPENTLPAFEAAVVAGADILETDVHASADDVAMVAHDLDLRRVATRADVVRDLPAATLQSIDLGGATMPTLSEALHSFPHARFSIDIKHAAAITPTVEAIKDARAEDRVMVASFSEARRSQVVGALPGITTAGTARHVGPAFLAHLVSQPKAVNTALAGVDALFIPPKAYGVSLLTPRFIQMVNDAGVELGVWTINDEDQMAQYWQAGVRAIVTDRSDLALAVRARLDGPRR